MSEGNETAVVEDEEAEAVVEATEDTVEAEATDVEEVSVEDAIESSEDENLSAERPSNDEDSLGAKFQRVSGGIIGGLGVAALAVFGPAMEAASSGSIDADLTVGLSAFLALVMVGAGLKYNNLKSSFITLAVALAGAIVVDAAANVEAITNIVPQLTVAGDVLDNGAMFEAAGNAATNTVDFVQTQIARFTNG